jgi:hypothetical protein
MVDALVYGTGWCMVDALVYGTDLYLLRIVASSQLVLRMQAESCI